MNCPCGSTQNGVPKTYENCCEPYIKRQSFPETAEQLMRSRYTAYTQCEMKYIKDTLAPESQHDFNLSEARKWAKESEWLGLEIISCKKGGKEDAEGEVKFKAKFKQRNKVTEHTETSQFRKNTSGHWLFVDGESTSSEEGGEQPAKPQPVVRESAKIGRNDPCPCGSGKKYKKCCGLNE